MDLMPGFWRTLFIIGWQRDDRDDKIVSLHKGLYDRGQYDHPANPGADRRRTTRLETRAMNSEQVQVRQKPWTSTPQ